MAVNYPFLFRSLIWSSCCIYLWRTALIRRDGERRGRTDTALRFVGALIALWLAVVAVGRGFGLFNYLF